ncbi:MAG: hypothetical protein U5J62_06345 [Desulfurivibrio sp.]|nr:hypothetical protein [Desulfurivibrio sp.]
MTRNNYALFDTVAADTANQASRPLTDGVSMPLDPATDRRDHFGTQESAAPGSGFQVVKLEQKRGQPHFSPVGEHLGWHQSGGFFVASNTSMTYILDMHTVVETEIFQRRAALIWSDAELAEFINCDCGQSARGRCDSWFWWLSQSPLGPFWMGKRGGSRVIYFNGEDGRVWLLIVYAKQSSTIYQLSFLLNSNTRWNMDKEMEQFQSDLLASVRQMKSGKGARETRVVVSPIVSARNASGMSQDRFAELLGVSKRTLQEVGAGSARAKWCGQDALTSCGTAPRGAARTGLMKKQKVKRLLSQYSV